MKDNFVTTGLNVGDLQKALNRMILNKKITEKSLVVIDSFDGYRIGVKKAIIEKKETITLTTILHQEQLSD